MGFVDRGAVARVKDAHAGKRYRATVAFDAPVDADRLAEAVSSLCGTIHQRTPRRVSHRRADRVRSRRLISASAVLGSPRLAVVELEADGGLYIKELISGDAGRTRPSLSERLGGAAAVTDLDVLEVRFDDLLGGVAAMDNGERLP